MARDFLIRIVGDASKGISELDKFAKKADDLTHVGQAGMIMGGLIAAGIGVAVAKYAEFDAAMSNVVATGADAAANQDALRSAAMEAGASTVFSATESANAIEELAKAGISAADTLSGGLAGSLDLAAAGGLGVADAASIMATAMTQFSVQGNRATHVADLLAAGAGKAQGDVSDLSMALGQAGLVANATGLSIEETTGGLAAFASAGLLGSDAGTSFKSMLQRLTPQSAEAQRVMDELGISAYDAQGNFIGLANFAGNLREKMQGLTPEARSAAMATIFGSDAVRAATILYNQGADGIRKWTTEVNDQGYAAQVAAQRLDNLQGDVEALGGAIDTALIQQGSGANDTLRALTTTATGIVEWFSQLPAPVQQAGLFLGAAAAAVGLFGGGAMVAVPKIVALKGAIDGTSFSLRGMSLAAGGVTVGLAAVLAVVAAVASEQAKATAQAEGYVSTLEEGSLRVTAATREMAKANLAASSSFLFFERQSAYDGAEKLGLSLEVVTDAALGQADALEQLSSVIKAGNGDTAEAQKLADQLGISLTDVSAASSAVSQGVLGQAGSLEKATEMARQKAAADDQVVASSESATEATGTAAAAYLSAADDTAELTDELDRLISSFNEANGVGQDAVTANARWKESLAGISAEVQRQRDEFERANGTVDGFSLSLDENTVSGSANAASLAGVARDAQAAAAAQYEVDKKTVGAKAAADNYAGTLSAQRQAFVDAALSAGYNADEVQRLADKVFALPPAKAVNLLANTGAASDNVARFRDLWESIRNRTVTLTTIGTTQIGGSQPASQGPMLGGYKYADGGEIRGPGTGTSDSILAFVSNGEFVVRESVASKNIEALHHLNQTGEFPAYKGGGLVGLAAASMSLAAPVAPLVSGTYTAAADAAARAAYAPSSATASPLVATLSDAQIDRMADRIGQAMGETAYPLIIAGAQRVVRQALRG
ncbi:phage tail tape measure protein [uncultured Microbacterium sp.]|uniref:phage tail tape measure protein n=1 Tax=uncultured Microbacterium sp. TaxID=191216 RepID=UPI0025FAB236|nr:phage tail tape measure protein [uncultured Microbacterium sp.]